jgi:hypothetical protein
MLDAEDGRSYIGIFDFYLSPACGRQVWNFILWVYLKSYFQKKRKRA